MLQNNGIAIIGAGNMGGAVARALANGNLVERGAISLSNPSLPKLERLAQECKGINITQSNIEAVKGARLVILAVKPFKLREVIEEIKPYLDYKRQIVASLAGGIGTEAVGEMLDKQGERPALYYLIPNTAVAVMQGMTFISSANSNEDNDAFVEGIFKATGEVMFVPEHLMNAGMTLASCGIAYIFRYIRAASEAGVELGFRPEQAQHIIGETMKGAVALLEATGSHPEAEIDRVTTAGGLTIKGLNAMEENGFTSAVIKGYKAPVKSLEK